MEITLTQLPVIEADFKSAENYLTEQLEGYKTVVFTEDTKKEAKETVANLRKDKKALQDRVKTLKKEYMKPFEDFSEKAMVLIEKYDEPIDYINGQVKAFEEKRVEEKKALISNIYLELIPEEEIQKALPLESIYNSKWENATATQKSIKEEIMQAKTDYKAAITSIKAFKSDKEDEAIQMYIRNHNLNECLEYLAQYEEYKKEIAERERLKAQQEMEERIRREEREKAELEARHKAELEQAQLEAQAEVEQVKENAEQAINEATEQVINNFIPEDTDEPTEDYSYSIKLTKEAKEKLEMFMDSIGIEYIEIDF